MEGINLVQLKTEYATDLLSLWSNENVMKYTYLDVIETKEQAKERIEYWLKQYTYKTFPNHFVILKDEEVVGVAGLPIIRKEPFCCGIYYQIKEEYQRQGIATKVVDLLKNKVFEKYPNGKIVTSCISSNEGSKKVLLRNGFVYSETKVGAFERNGFIDDVERYTFLND